MSPSLYSDHVCDRNNFPLQAVLDLNKHIGELWFVEFSHSGTRLAVCGSDITVTIYDVEDFEIVHTLLDHEGGVCSVAWSPDDTMLVTCSQDNRARLWDAITGECLRTISRFGEPVSSCVWAPDGQTFVTGCLDKDRNLCQWNLTGSLVYDWQQSHRIQDLAVSPDGNRLIAMDHERHIFVYNFVTRELEYTMDMKVKMTSISISQDSRYMLINKTDGEAALLDIETRQQVRIFTGQKAGEFVIRSNFGGANEAFVISGSEDGHIFIWHKENGTLVEKLDGHGGVSCNSVSWNPTNPCMFASAGDDSRVRIWSNEYPPGTAPSKDLGQSNGANRTSAW